MDGQIPFTNDFITDLGARMFDLYKSCKNFQQVSDYCKQETNGWFDEHKDEWSFVFDIGTGAITITSKEYLNYADQTGDTQG